MTTPEADSPVTLVVACYNHARFVDQALEAVAAQTLRPRLIVTDDASRDGTAARAAEALERLGLDAVTIFHTENRGLCPTFNEALAAVRTPYVAFISADDWMEPQRIELQVDRLRTSPAQPALVHSDMFVDVEGETGDPELYSRAWSAASAVADGHVYHELFTQNFIATPTVMLRTDAVRAVGGFDEELPFEDYDLYLRIAQRYALEYDPTPLVHYRRHGANLTDDASVERRNRWLRAVLHIYAKHLDGDPRVRRIAAVRMFDAACRLYKAGEGPARSYVPVFLRYARLHRQPRGVAFAALAALGVPGTLLPRERSRFWQESDDGVGSAATQ